VISYCSKGPRKPGLDPPFLLRPRSRTSSREELANTISHCIGLIAAAIATPILLIAAWGSGSVAFFAGTIVFAATMLILYFVSMLYHAWPQSRAKQTLQLLDHCAIFLLIAGTYTPFSLGPLRGIWGFALLGTIWLVAIFGVIIKAIRGPSRHRGLGLSLYLGMGWSALIIIRPVFSNLPAGAFFWLMAGGIAYTAGVLFFVNERMRYAHFIWHLFVLTGTSCHFLALLACTA
jgi:hemolysin III